MTILTANLKHLYQRRGAWFWYLYLVCLTPVFVIMGVTSTSKRFMGYLFISFFSSMIVTSIQKEILSKPFSFCMPGHNLIPHKVFFRVGVVLNVLLGFLFMLHPGIEFTSVILVVAAASVVGMLVYLMSVYLHFKDLQKYGFLWFVLVAGVYAAVFKKWDVVVQEAIVNSPLVVISSGVLLCWGAIKLVDIESIRRTSCGKMAITAFDGYNKEKMARYKLAKLAEKDKKKSSVIRTSSAVDGFFLSRICQCQAGSLGRYIWGGLYRAFGLQFSNYRQSLKGFFIFVPLVICYFCYMPGNGKNFIFIMPAFIILHMRLWVHSSMSVSGGRRERFWSGLTVALSMSTLITAFVFVVAIVTNLMNGVMPPMTVRGHEFIFKALDVTNSYIPFLIIPFVFTVGLVFNKKPLCKIVILIVSLQLVFVTSFISTSKYFDWLIRSWPLLIVPLLLLSWGVFVGVLHNISMRRCLVGNK